MSFLMLLQLFIFTTLTSLANAAIEPSAFPASSTITRDVCIIGGGSTGTYSAVRLGDSGKSVVVVEAKNLLGGHTNTYTDPGTNETVDYGVQIFHNLDSVRKYFARFDIPLQTAVLGSPGSVADYVDFRTGKLLPGFNDPDPSAAFAAYGAQAAKYPYLEAGFDLPDPVPADLLLPFGEFVKKYNLAALVPTLFRFVEGVGNILDRSTLYIFKYFGVSALQDLSIGFLTTVRQDNSELYRKALTELGQNVLLNSHVITTDRSGPDGVKVLVQTPTGRKLILAKKLIITIPPKLDNLVGFDLSRNETSLFAQFINTGYYTALIRNTSIPPHISLTNTAPETPYNLPPLPGLYSISETRVPGLYYAFVGSETPALSDGQVKSLITDSVLRLRAAGTLNTTAPKFAAYEDHAPFELRVSREAIAGGFYKRLYALQGQRHTWYTGAAFHVHDSSLLWQFTEGLLPAILA